MRGKPSFSVVFGLPIRITPAGAGKTITHAAQLHAASDHPRRCGENLTPLPKRLKPTGSPPQVRGKLFSIWFCSGAARITPAGAGKTINKHSDNFRTKDHPRRCGENVFYAICVTLYKGSPPQVRGKHRQRTDLLLLCRITPAGAGKTFCLRTVAPPRRDHPRRCGENVLFSFLLPMMLGSPPQMRGKLESIAPFVKDMRITPADAGKTIFCCLAALAEQDHPRRCGENQLLQKNCFKKTGSPPQMRGKLVVLPYRDRVNGITPADAGKTVYLL